MDDQNIKKIPINELRQEDGAAEQMIAQDGPRLACADHVCMVLD